MTDRNFAPAFGSPVVDVAAAERVVAGLAAPDLECIETIEALDDLREDWMRLEQAAARPQNFFQSHSWCSAWARVYLNDSGSAALKTIVGRVNGRVVMIWPLMVVRHGPVTVLKWLSDPVGQYGDVLLDPAVDTEDWLTSAWIRIGHDPDIDAIALRGVREDARVHAFLAARCDAPTEQQLAPQLNLKPFATVEDHTRSLSKNQRSQRKKLLNRLRSSGPVSFEIHRGDAHFETAVSQALAFKKEWLEANGFASGIVGDPRYERFLLELGRADPEAVAAGVLTCAGEPLSIDIAYAYRQRYYGTVIAENAAADARSPVKVHFDLRQKRCISDGFTEFDLMAPETDFKQHWTDGTTVVRDFVAPINLWGFFYCTVFLRTLRPFFKQIYYGVGAGPRKALLGPLGLLPKQT